MGHHQHPKRKLRRPGVGRERFIQTLYAREVNESPPTLETWPGLMMSTERESAVLLVHVRV